MIRYISPVWKANNLQDCLRDLQLLEPPTKMRRAIIFYSYFLFMTVFTLRTLVLPLYSTPLLDAIMCYSRHEPQVYRATQMCAILCYIETLSARVWLYWRHHKNKGINFDTLLQEFNPHHHKWLMMVVKFSGNNLAVMGPAMLILVISWQVQQSGLSDILSLCSLILWIPLFMYFSRIVGFDMIVIYAVTYAVSVVIHEQLTRFHHSLTARESTREMKRRYEKVINSLSMTNAFVARMNGTNQLTLIPLCGLVISQLMPHADDDTHQFERIGLIIAGIMYCARSYVMTACCSRLHVKSQLIYSEVASLLARSDHARPTKQWLLLMSQDIGSKSSHLLFFESKGDPITQLDLLKNMLGTFEFFLLSIKFRGTIL